jgi:hypothetical protein
MQFELGFSKAPIKLLNRYEAKDHLLALPKYAHPPVPSQVLLEIGRYLLFQ